RNPNIWDALSSFDFSSVSIDGLLQRECAAQALGAGFTTSLIAGLARYAVTRSLRTTVNWTMAGFLLPSVFSWEFCRFQRREAQKQMEQL
ncbi:hypothetical protein EDD86DRAFT_179494, partial [Gorgonomyces haynaldii]